MLLVRFSFCECGSVVCMSPRPAQRSVLPSASTAGRANAAASAAQTMAARADRIMAPPLGIVVSCGVQHGRAPPVAAIIARWTAARGRIRAPHDPRAPPPGTSVRMREPRSDLLLERLALGMAADAVPLARRIERARATRAGVAEWEKLADSGRAFRRAERGARGAPAGDPISGGASGRRARRRNRTDDPRPCGRDRRGRDGLGQDHAVAEDLPRRGPRGARPDRPHAAAPDRGARGRRENRAGAWNGARRRSSGTRCASPTTRSPTRSSR